LNELFQRELRQSSLSVSTARKSRANIDFTNLLMPSGGPWTWVSCEKDRERNRNVYYISLM